MKKVFLRLIVFLLVFALLGCQNTGSTGDTINQQTQADQIQSVIETEILESESTLNLPVSTKTIAEMVQAPERMVYEFENPELPEEYGVNVGIDAKIVIPAVDSMDVVPLKSKIITEDDVKVLCEQFFSEKAVYNPEEWIESFMEYLEGNILTVEEHYESQKEYADSSVFDELDRMSEEDCWTMEMILYLLDNMKGQHPDYKFSVLKNANGEDTTLNLICAIDGDYIKCLSIVNNCVQYLSYKLDREDIMQMITIYLKEHIGIYSHQGYMWTAAYRSSDFVNDDRMFDITRQEVSDLFATLLLQCGFDNYTVEYTKRSGTDNPSWIIDSETREHYLANRYFYSSSRKYYEGVSIFGGDHNSRIFSGTAGGNYYEDGWEFVIIEPTWTYEEPLVENVELLPYDRIEAVIKEVIDDDLNNDNTNTAMTKVKVTDIRLEYGILHDKELDADVLIPVWNCYTSTHMDENGGNVEEGEYYFTHHINIMTINAIDGSIIRADNGSWLAY